VARKVDYEQYIHSEEWDRKRQWALTYWGYKCATCFTSNNLEVHHRTYERLGHELITDLIVLCDDCHGKFHETIHRAESTAHISAPLTRVFLQVMGRR